VPLAREAGNFRATGFMDAFDPRTRRRMPNPVIQVDAAQPATTIYVRYVEGGTMRFSMQAPMFFAIPVALCCGLGAAARSNAMCSNALQPVC
jgi:hypothetical protein